MSLPIDLYSRDVLANSTPAFEAIREAGPVVWLPKHRMWAIARYADVRAALRADDQFLSGDGVAANPIANRMGRLTTLSSDSAVHVARRKVLMQSLGAKRLAPLEERIQSTANALVDRLVGGGPFDGVRDFASGVPLQVVADLVGVRVDSKHILRWGQSIFDTLGPMNRRAIRATPSSLGLWWYTQRLTPAKVVPGSWASTVFDAADRGDITRAEARTMVIDFVVPSLDTTILAASHMLWCLGKNPDAWAAIRADPSLVPAAVVESVRLASPVRGFTRRVAQDTEIDGTTLRKGSRVALLYAAANLDPDQFPNPEAFDLGRPPTGHLGWGNGPHTCVGIHLAKLEMQSLLRAMIPRVEHITVDASSQPLSNNCLQGHRSYGARLTAPRNRRPDNAARK